jgi:hypothetical protein
MTEKEIINVLLFIAKKEQQQSAVYALEYTGLVEKENQYMNTKKSSSYNQLAEANLDSSVRLLECIHFLEEKLVD